MTTFWRVIGPGNCLPYVWYTLQEKDSQGKKNTPWEIFIFLKNLDNFILKTTENKIGSLELFEKMDFTFFHFSRAFFNFGQVK